MAMALLVPLIGCSDSQKQSVASVGVAISAQVPQESSEKFINILDTKHICRGMNGRQASDYKPNIEISGTHIADKLQSALESPCAQELQRPLAEHYSRYQNISLTLYDGKCEFSKDVRLAAMQYEKIGTGVEPSKGCWTLAGTGMDAVIAYRVGEIQGTAAAYEAFILEPISK